MLEKSYKYLYEIKQTNPKPGEAIYYRGSRKSQLPPEQDFWIKYFTSSKLVAKKIKEEGIGAFEIVEIKPLPDECNIQYEEHLYLIEVDARQNPLYFNQHNNEGFHSPESSLKVCPHCYHKNYGNPFEKCTNCKKLMSEFYCGKCGKSLEHSIERCSCGYSRNDEIKFKCLKCGSELDNNFHRCSCGYSRNDELRYPCVSCGKELSNPFERCSCGYSRVDDIKYKCVKCGNKLNAPNEKCSCGYSKVYGNNHQCVKCGNQLKHQMERCSCGYSRIDDVKYHCAKCGKMIRTASSRCSCGYSKIDDTQHKCVKCGQGLKTAASRCSCGYSRMDDVKFSCAKCGNELKAAIQRCSCGYSRIDDIKYHCAKCGKILEHGLERCSCGYSRMDDANYICVKCGNKLSSTSARCSQCKITKAGYKDWEKYNPIYRLSLNDEIIFQGYKHLCIEFMIEELICSKHVAHKWLKGNVVVFEPKKQSEKYPNSIKYSGLKAELIPYTNKNND